jgi:hypothetical protein
VQLDTLEKKRGREGERERCWAAEDEMYAGDGM